MPRVDQHLTVADLAPISTEVTDRDPDGCILETVSDYGLFTYTIVLTLNPDKSVATVTHTVADA